MPVCIEQFRHVLVRLAISQPADLQATVHRDETGDEQRADAKHKAHDAVPKEPCLPKHPGMTQAHTGREGLQCSGLMDHHLLALAAGLDVACIVLTVSSPWIPTWLLIGWKQSILYLEMMKSGTPKKLKPKWQRVSHELWRFELLSLPTSD